MNLKLVKMDKKYYWRINKYNRYNCLICGKKIVDDFAYFDYPVGSGWMHIVCVEG